VRRREEGREVTEGRCLRGFQVGEMAQARERRERRDI
jgi:hypothetical protein